MKLKQHVISSDVKTEMFANIARNICTKNV